jgi:putative addiction module component (TIGR02574 family)
MPTPDEILSDALQLPTEARARIAHELLRSLEPEEGCEGEDLDEAWEEEIARRAEEVLNGTVKTVPQEEVEAWIAARLRQPR